MVWMTLSGANFESAPEVCSHAPRGKDDGFQVTISWERHEDAGGDLTLYLDADDAEDLGRNLLGLVSAAKQGSFTGFPGLEANEDPDSIN